MNKYEKPKGSYISFMSNKVKTHGGINLAQGIPGFDPPKELLEELKHMIDLPLHQYAPGQGNHDLLDVLVRHYHSLFPVEKENFLIVQGATEAISLLFLYFTTILKGNEGFLAFDPVYESYRHLPRIFQRPFVAFERNKDGSISFEKLEKEILQHHIKAIFLSTPGNPFGRIWKKEELQQLLAICEEKDIFLVIDAVYRDLYFHEPPYIPLDRSTKHLFYVNSFSKLLSITGWRIGYLMAHPDHMNKISDMHDYTGLCAPSVLQQALANYLKKYDFGEDYVNNVRNQLRENFAVLHPFLENAGFYLPENEGGYFIWTGLPNRDWDGFYFAMDLYEQEKIAVIPGIHFSHRYNHFIRINIAREKKEILKAMEGLEKFLRKYK